MAPRQRQGCCGKFLITLSNALSLSDDDNDDEASAETAPLPQGQWAMPSRGLWTVKHG